MSLLTQMMVNAVQELLLKKSLVETAAKTPPLSILLCNPYLHGNRGWGILKIFHSAPLKKNRFCGIKTPFLCYKQLL